jgi:ribosomal protein L19E
MDRIWLDPELKIATSEYRSDVGYLVREFEIEAERKKAEMKNEYNQTNEKEATSKKPFLTRLFNKRRTPR